MENKQVKIIQPRRKIDYNENGEQIFKLKRVCAYCRVSTDNDEQKTSIENQVDEYTKRIKNNPEWEFAGVFIDEGISGTNTRKRDQFNAMIRQARNKNFDLILAKSVARFARNTVDCLNYVRELRLIGVEIFFEKEGIYSSDPKVDFLLTIMSSIAQEEARNTSENVKWTFQKKFKEGVPMLNHSRFLGYTKDKRATQLKIVESEAKIVKELFALYAGGIGPAEIIRIFESKGYKTGAGSTKWRNTTILSMLRNEKYCGNLLLQKTITQDYLTHKRVKNKDLAPMYHIENSHEAIIDKETFETVQQIMRDRAKVKIGDDKNLSKYTRRYPFSGFVICNNCGRTLKRRYWNYSSNKKVVMQCGSYLEGKGNCDAKAIEQNILEKATIKVLNEVFLSNLNITQDLYRAVLTSVNVLDNESKIDELNDEITALDTQISSLVDLKISGQIALDMFNSKYQDLVSKMKSLEYELKSQMKKRDESFEKTLRVNKMKEIIKNISNISEVEIDVLRTFIYRIIAVNQENIVYCIAKDKQYSDEEFSNKRKDFLLKEAIAKGKVIDDLNGKVLNYKVIII